MLNGAVNEVVKGTSIVNLPALILGGATLNTQYNDNPKSIPLIEMIRYAFQNGIRAIDTSPYYGESEILYGKALEYLRAEYPREHYFICSKAGRIKLDEFDYSRSSIRKSVLRSCERLKTDYIDVMFLHDVEFIETKQVLEALKELRKLKDEGVIHNFGISGYPVDFLLTVALKSCEMVDIGPLDVVLSYANLNLQNMTLNNYYSRFKHDAGVKVVENGSILSMSLLRTQETKSFHPCSAKLRTLACKAAEYTASQGEDLALLATRFAISKWVHKGPTVLGVSSVQELRAALESYWDVMNIKDQDLSVSDAGLVAHIQQSIFGNCMNETWVSGIEH
ncbi:LAME_0H12596g1_1 [Lachancea meyersii CBS 8951]|uniref:LAME_0H12596g1_1 n=1 Tax=Lachancea meyersii CBS 8951 TaxID=1266667 RepID=A0A1G4KGS6_9SACH|nr:LAME_0H12596g1_1 [Lachancea meyersii CBS 8951]